MHSEKRPKYNHKTAKIKFLSKVARNQKWQNECYILDGYITNKFTLLKKFKYSWRKRVGRPRRRGIDDVFDCMRESSLTERQADKIVNDMNAWRSFVRGALGSVPGDES